MTYSLTPMTCASGVSIPYFKITAPLYLASPSFPKNISTPRLGKHIVKHTINYHPSPWRLTSLININNRIGIIVKCICGSKKKKRNYSFLLMLSWQNSPEGSYHWPPPNSHPPSVKLLIHPGSSIFWKPPLVERKGERRRKKLSILKNVFYFEVNSVV